MTTTQAAFVAAHSERKQAKCCGGTCSSAQSRQFEAEREMDAIGGAS